MIKQYIKALREELFLLRAQKDKQTMRKLKQFSYFFNSLDNYRQHLNLDYTSLYKWYTIYMNEDMGELIEQLLIDKSCVISNCLICMKGLSLDT